MWQQFVLMSVITALQIMLTDFKMAAKLRKYIIQVRDLCLMLAPLEEVRFNKKAAMRKPA